MKRETQQAIGEAMLQQLSERINERMGLHFVPERWGDLERGLRHAARDFGFEGADAARQCAAWLLNAPLLPAQIDTLARHLTIGETYFFRDPAVFEALRRHVLPELIRVRRERGEKTLRFWSAACCTGEEPYSLAILLMQTLPDLLPDWRQWRISILGTDLNPYFLQKARSGVYTPWSFRDAARDEQDRFFTKTPAGFEIKDEIRHMVKFAALNFITDEFPSLHNGTNAQDFIFCRNVLMYFQKDQARSIVEKLMRCLVADGFLAPSASEVSAQLFAPLQTVNWPGALFYRRTNTNTPSLAMPSQIAFRKPAPRVKPTPKPAVARPTPASQPPLRAAVSETPKDDPQAWHESARRCANLGQLDEALRWCDRAIAAEKMNARHHYLRASILMEQSGTMSDSEAEQSLRRTIYLEPDFALAHFALGNMARRRGDATVAQKSWTTALDLLEEADPQTQLPESEALTAGHLAAIIKQALAELK